MALTGRIPVTALHVLPHKGAGGVIHGPTLRHAIGLLPLRFNPAENLGALRAVSATQDALASGRSKTSAGRDPRERTSLARRDLELVRICFLCDANARRLRL